jgi:hypothetical protein
MAKLKRQQHLINLDKSYEGKLFSKRKMDRAALVSSDGNYHTLILITQRADYRLTGLNIQKVSFV